MAEITAAAVMALRDKTGLPMMECKKALLECGGNTEEAVEWLRKQGIKTQAMRADRETSTGRLAVFADPAKNVGTIIELKCESAPVANSPDFKALADPPPSSRSLICARAWAMRPMRGAGKRSQERFKWANQGIWQRGAGQPQGAPASPPGPLSNEITLRLR